MIRSHSHLHRFYHPLQMLNSGQYFRDDRGSVVSLATIRLPLCVRDFGVQLATQLRNLHAEIAHAQRQPYGGQGNDGTSIIPEVLTAVEHLERVIESMQVAMTANHALLSNRLYHHQQLPLERAHPLGPSRIAPSSEATSLLAQAKARVAGGLEPLMPSQQDRNEETQEH